MSAPSFARVANALDALGIDCERRSDKTWSLQLPSAARGSIAVGVFCAERTVSLNAFFMRGPDRAHQDVYRSLLRRNLDLRDWRFAIDDHGDLFLAAALPVSEITESRLDDLLGTLIFAVDETYDGVLRTGFVVPDGAATHRPTKPPGES